MQNPRSMPISTDIKIPQDIYEETKAYFRKFGHMEWYVEKGFLPYSEPSEVNDFCFVTNYHNGKQIALETKTREFVMYNLLFGGNKNV